MPDQTVQTPEPPQTEPDPRWDSRQSLGRALRLGALAIPLIISVGFALVLIAILPAPGDSGQSVGWWITVGLAIIVVAVGSARAAERFAPMVSLPVLDLRWPHAAIVVLGSVAGLLAALTLPDGTPELIAYANLEAAEDSNLSVTIGEGNPPDVLTILLVDGPATAEWTGTDIVVTGDPDANGDVLVVYEACWGNDCKQGQFTATFTPVNDAPVAVVDVMTAASLGPVTLMPLVNDSDVDQDTLAVESAEITAGRAQVEIAGNDLVVTPDDDEPQTIDLAYTVIDGAGGRGEGTAQVVVPDFNEAPIVVADAATVLAGQTVEVAVLENDRDPEGEPLLLVSAVLGEDSVGSLEIDDEVIRFTAALVTATTDVQYEVSDGERVSTGFLTITIDPPDPQPADDQATTQEDTTVVFDVVGNDLAPASAIDPSSVRIVSATLGTATAGNDGTVRFVPDFDAYGIGSVLYEVCNAASKCATAGAEIQIERVNDLPSFVSGSDILARSGDIFSRPWAKEISVGEDNEPTQSVSFIVTAADPSLFATPPSIDPSGVLRFNAGVVIGSTQVTVVASDGQDQSTPITFTISIS